MSHQVRRTAWSVFWFLIGLVCTGVGVGLGIPHAAKSGVSGGTILGLALILLGLTALGYGVLGLLRSTRRRWWLLTGPAMLLAAYVGLSSVAQPVAATHVPDTPLSGRTPASLGLPYEAVSFDTTDGVSLAGWYLSSRNGAAVAVLHGSGGNRTSVLDHAAVLSRHGYGVLLFDARGHGLSGGTAMDFGWYGESDTRAATTYLLGRPDVVEGRVGAVGLSMGGEEAIGAAGVDRRVRAVVAEGATNRVFGDKGWLARYGVRGQAQRAVEWLTYRVTDVLSDADEPMPLRDAVAMTAPRPVLLVVAGDVRDERLAAEFIRSGSPGTVAVWEVPDTGHTDGLETHPDEWASRVTGFLDKALDVEGPS